MRREKIPFTTRAYDYILVHTWQFGDLIVDTLPQTDVPYQTEIIAYIDSTNQLNDTSIIQMS